MTTTPRVWKSQTQVNTADEARLRIRVIFECGAGDNAVRYGLPIRRYSRFSDTLTTTGPTKCSRTDCLPHKLRRAS